MQETFLRMLDAPPKIIIESPQAYLFRVAKSVARVTSSRLAVDANLFVPDIVGEHQAEDAPDRSASSMAASA